ncbi:MAG: efflux transporter periplasmic adaptor subunit [Azospira oryzae]|nr:MAG: efflux transporter periplasmic adaptor subunit [Azospira oryzae]
MKRIITIGVVVLVILAILFTLIKNKKTLDSKNVVTDRSAVPVAVTLIQVAQQAITEQINIPATLIAQEEASIVVSSSGRIVSLSFKLGSVVRKGQVIGHLDVDELKLKLQSAEVSIAKLTKDLERNKILVEGNATNAKTVQDSQFDLDSKRLEADQLRKQISNGVIQAPISGIISEKQKEAGEYVGNNEMIGKVVNTNSLKARVYVSENNVFKLKNGQRATITTEVFPTETFNGIISFISPQGDDNHNYLVELAVDNNKSSRLKAGMYAMINFNESGTSTALQIPKSALVDGVKNPYVYVADGNKAVEKKIIIGREWGNKVEVISGLQEGDQIIMSGQINIVNGSTIKAIASN